MIAKVLLIPLSVPVHKSKPKENMKVIDHNKVVSLFAMIFHGKCGPVVKALALRSGDPGFKTRSDH